jgi:hypothetical protein
VIKLMAKCEWVDEIVLGSTSFEVSDCCNQSAILCCEAYMWVTGHYFYGESKRYHSASLHRRRSETTRRRKHRSVLSSLQHHPGHGSKPLHDSSTPMDWRRDL